MALSQNTSGYLDHPSDLRNYDAVQSSARDGTMQISSDNATQHAGRDINSHNTLTVHHHHPTQSPTVKAQLRCPLPSPKFVGRKDELCRLKEFFTSPEQDLKRFALIGMGGCGKSQIASQFTHGHILKEKLYDPSRVFFIDATTIATLEQSYASIAQSNGVGSSAEDALLWLSNTQEASFVLIDNADDPDLDLATYIPRSMKVDVLITTRLHDKGRLHASAPDAFIDLDALPREDAEELLIRTAVLHPGVSEDVSVLVQELHCYALAVAQAGACIAFLQLTVDKYLEQFRLRGTSLMDGKHDGVNSSGLHGYLKVVPNTWKLSYDQLPVPSKDLFNLCAFLHHTGITQALFQRATEALETYDPTIPLSPAADAALAAVTKALELCKGDNGSFDDFAFQRCIGPILSLSLMRRDPITGVYSIHPLVLDSLRRLISDHLPTSILLMLAILANQGDTPFLYHLLPHIDCVRGCFTVEEGPSQPAQCHPDIAMAFGFVYVKSAQWSTAVSLLRACLSGRTTGLSKTHEHTLEAASFLSFVLKESGQLEAAEILGRSVLADWTCKCGEDHPGTIMASVRLAIVLFDLGRYGEAEKMQLNVLSRYRRLLSEDHTDTVSAMNNLANTWSRLGRYEEAENMQLSVLSQHRRLLGKDHPDTVCAMRNLANIWLCRGRYKEAEEMRLGVLSQHRRLLGESHPDTLMDMNNLADIWSCLGRYKEAEKMQLDVLSRRRHLLGEDHPQTVQAMHNLAITWSRLGQYEEAEKMLLDVLSRCRRLLGEDHPDTVLAMHNLAPTWSHLGRYEEAEKMQLDVLSQRRRLLGEDHPDTALAMNNLAKTWSDLRRYEEAEKMQLDVLSQRRRLLGEDHPKTILAMNNLAKTWSDLERHEEAEKMRLDVLSRRRRLLGEDHPKTILAMNNLANTWSHLERHEEVEKMRLDVLSQRRRLLGEDHPHTISAMNNLAKTWSDLGRYEEAETMQLDVVSQRRRLLGEDHPETVKAMALMDIILAHDLKLDHEIEEPFQEALQQQNCILGEYDPDTIQSAESLARIPARREAPKRAEGSRSRRLIEKLKRPFRRS